MTETPPDQSDAVGQPKEQVDPQRTGLNFVDLLFALVAQQCLQPFIRHQELTGPAKTHLALAFATVILSWIGYHNSWNRPTHFVRFRLDNHPFGQFVVDVGLVIAYGALTITAEGQSDMSGAGQSRPLASAAPEALLLAIIFGLYVTWDYIATRMRRSHEYESRPASKIDHRRLTVTRVFFGLSVMIAAVTALVDLHSHAAVVAIDVALIVFVAGFRFAKEAIRSKPLADEGE